MLARLFPEILSYTMILAQEFTRFDVEGVGGGYDSDVDMPSQQPFEIAISHVNSSIRSTALLTARLWSSINIDTGAQDANITLQRTKAYLERSNGHSLNVRIELTETPRPSNGLLHQVMEMIAEESKRWRKLSILAEHDGMTDMTAGIRARLIDDGEKDLTPDLEFLSISVDYSEVGYAAIGRRSDGGLRITGVETPPSNARGMYSHPSQTNENVNSMVAFRRVTFGKFPKLSFLRLRSLALFLFQPTLLLGLQTLHLDQTKAIPLSFTFLSSVIAACPVLEHLSIYGDVVMPSRSRVHDGGIAQQASSTMLGSEPLFPRAGSEGFETGSQAKQAGESVIRLPELRSLRISGTTGTVFTVLLSRLKAPKLRCFSVKNAQEHDLDAFWNEPAIMSSVYSSAKNWYGGSPRVLGHVSKFNQMRSLTVNNSDLSQSVYQRLFQTFPMIVDFATYSSIDIETAPKLLAKGAAGVPWPHLRTLTFVFDVDLDGDDVMLEVLLKQRRESGHPIEKVRIGVAELDPEETEAQQAIVIMESLDSIDTWPLNPRYLDIDDILF
jgi:hypothetical protein